MYVEIILVRHAQSVANEEGLYQGQTYDTDLTKLGKKQADALMLHLGKRFSNLDAIYCSPLKRTVQTAEILTKGLMIGEPILDKRIIEIDHGLWDRKTVEQVRQEFSEEYNNYIRQPDLAIMPEGETLLQVWERMMDFLKTVHEKAHQRIVVVTHDMVIRLLITKALRRPLKDLWLYELDNAGYSLLEIDNQILVVEVNTNEHLEGLRTTSADQAV